MTIIAKITLSLPMFKNFRFSFADVCPDDETLAAAMQTPDTSVLTELKPFIKGVMDELIHNDDIAGGYSLHRCTAVDTNNGCIYCDGTMLQTGHRVSTYMKGASMIAVFVCTAGSIFTSLAERYMRNGDITEAFITDAIGSVTVENAMDMIQTELEKEMANAGYNTTNRYSPGYCEWHVSGQKSLFTLINSDTVGISLTESCLMLPIKSVSGIIGIGNSVTKRPYGCDICGSKTCVYRKIRQK